MARPAAREFPCTCWLFGYKAHPMSSTFAAPSDAPSTVPHERIAERAYGIWEASGYPHGHDHQHWFQAERELRG